MITLIAQEGSYLTQVTLEDENNRVFAKKLCGAAINPSDWHEVDESVKLTWEEQHLSTEYIN